MFIRAGPTLDYQSFAIGEKKYVGMDFQTNPAYRDFSQGYIDNEINPIFEKLRQVREEDFVKLKENIDSNNTLNRCWNVMNSIRNNALCLRCSGDA